MTRTTWAQAHIVEPIRHRFERWAEGLRHLARAPERALDEDPGAYSERDYGRFDRIVALPEAIDPDQARARLRHGLLVVEAPLVAPTSRPARSIAIE